MKDSIRHLIQQALTRLTADGVLPEGLSPAIQVENTKDKTHGDFASNIAMMLAKPAGMKPRDLAEKLLDALPTDVSISKVEIAGPGFLNFYQNTQTLEQNLQNALADTKFGVQKTGKSERVVIDLSSPNLAKEMHVGHLRSTIIGDCVARVLEFLGDTVIRQNHVGDWGTQFGMLLAFMEANPSAAESKLADLEGFYRAAKKCFDESPEFADRSRELVVQLQGGEENCLRLWHRFNDISLSHCQKVYDRLNVKLSMADIKGESAYNDDLPGIIEILREMKLLSESNGAQCVFMDEFKNSDGEPLPVIVQKTGGGYLYATTDLAAMRYRSQVLHADRILYFVDQRQALHFQMVFAVARLAGFVHEGTKLEHMGFGTMNGPDGRPFKTRDGGVVKLIDLLDEAESKAEAVLRTKNPRTVISSSGAPVIEHSREKSPPPAQMHKNDIRGIAKAVGIGAVKYADLSKHRTSDYIFNFEQMLSFEGNTAPYLMYAYTRVRSIFRKVPGDWNNLPGKIQLKEEQELALGIKLDQFSDVLNIVAEKGTPHILCAYLYDLAGLFSSFYENCPILNIEDTATRESRLLLATLSGRTLKQGLELLGLQALERM